MERPQTMLVGKAVPRTFDWHPSQIAHVDPWARAYMIPDDVWDALTEHYAGRGPMPLFNPKRVLMIETKES